MEAAIIFLLVSMGIALLLGAIAMAFVILATWKDMKDDD